MSGRTELFQIGVCALASLAIVTDLIWGRIFNWLTLGALALGLGLSAWWGGWAGLESSGLGALCGLALYGWMFFLRFLGGGDVKLLMALGAWGGSAYALEVALLGILGGGLLALAMLAARGRLADLARRIYRFLYTVIVPVLEVEAVKIDRRETMPFGVPISIAAVWAAFAHPLRLWGMW